MARREGENICNNTHAVISWHFKRWWTYARWCVLQVKHWHPSTRGVVKASFSEENMSFPYGILVSWGSVFRLNSNAIPRSLIELTNPPAVNILISSLTIPARISWGFNGGGTSKIGNFAISSGRNCVIEWWGKILYIAIPERRLAFAARKSMYSSNNAGAFDGGIGGIDAYILHSG